MRSAQHGTQAGTELFQRKWFDQIIIRSTIKSLDPVRNGILCSQKQDRCVIIPLSDER